MDLSAFIRLLKTHVVEGEPEHIVRFKSPRAFRVFSRRLQRLKKSVKVFEHIQPIPLIHGFSCSLRSLKEWKKYRAFLQIEKNSQVQVNHALHHFPSLQPPQQVHVLDPKDLTSKLPYVPWGVKHICAPRVWNKTKGKQIHIGVVDTGADYSHDNIKRALGPGINLVQRYLPPYDDNGHGTHIAGTIAASQRKGILGVAPQAVIHPIKAFDHKGTAYVSDIIQGLEWCIRHQIDVINMSFGMKTRSAAMYQAVLNAYRKGIIVVASSGNDGISRQIDYPAKFRETLSIGAADRRQRVAKFSNRGRDIDLYAPGDRIYSTWPRQKYAELSGTSMATAHVSGTVALLLALDRSLTPGQIKALLLDSAQPLRGPHSARRLELHAAQAVRQLRHRKRQQRRERDPQRKPAAKVSARNSK